MAFSLKRTKSGLLDDPDWLDPTTDLDTFPIVGDFATDDGSFRADGVLVVVTFLDGDDAEVPGTFDLQLLGVAPSSAVGTASRVKVFEIGNATSKSSNTAFLAPIGKLPQVFVRLSSITAESATQVTISILPWPTSP